LNTVKGCLEKFINFNSKRTKNEKRNILHKIDMALKFNMKIASVNAKRKEEVSIIDYFIFE
jgi:hypothetical protein